MQKEARKGSAKEAGAEGRVRGKPARESTVQKEAAKELMPEGVENLTRANKAPSSCNNRANYA